MSLKAARTRSSLSPLGYTGSSRLRLQGWRWGQRIGWRCCSKNRSASGQQKPTSCDRLLGKQNLHIDLSGCNVQTCHVLLNHNVCIVAEGLLHTDILLRRPYTFANLHALGVPNVLCAWVRPHVSLGLGSSMCPRQ